MDKFDILGHICGEYELLSEIKTEGGSKLFLLYDKVCGRKALMKSGKAELIENEARILFELSGKGIPAVYGCFERDGKAYLFRQYIEGRTLREYIGDFGVLPTKKAAELGVKICEIISRLHSSDPPIIHRDIKADNIILTAEEEVYLIDFGISREYNRSAARDTCVMGTLSSAPPEQFGYGQTDERSDIYSLGVLLREMTEAEGKKSAGKLSAVIKKCTMFSPEDRYKSVSEIKSDLLKITTDRKVPKKFVAAAAAVLLCAASVSASITYARNLVYGEFETAHEAVANMHAGINIGNTLSSCDIECDWYAGDGINPGWNENHQGPDPEAYETAWGNPQITKEYIAAIKDAGFDSVRLAVTWGNHADKDGNINKAWLDRVQEVADMIIAEDMYCIIDMHNECHWVVPTEENYNKNLKRVTRMFKDIANRFKNYDEKLILQTFNKLTVWDTEDGLPYVGAEEYLAYVPEGKDYIEWQNKYNQLFVDTVRKTGGNNRFRNLVIGTYSNNLRGSNGKLNDYIFDEYKIPDDKYKDHIITDIHYYEPGDFCLPETDVAFNKTDLNEGWEAQHLANDMAYMNAFQKKTGSPVIIGEFGAVYKNNNDDIVKFIKDYITTAKKYGIAAFWWDNCSVYAAGQTYRWWDGQIDYSMVHDKYGIFDRSAAKVGWTEAADALILYSYNGKLPSPELKGTEKNNSVTLEWNDLSGAYGYKIYEYNAKSGKYEQIDFVSGSKRTIKNLLTGTHKYRIVPVAKYNGKDKDGSPSNVINVTVK